MLDKTYLLDPCCVFYSLAHYNSFDLGSNTHSFESPAATFAGCLGSQMLVSQEATLIRNSYSVKKHPITHRDCDRRTHTHNMSTCTNGPAVDTGIIIIIIIYIYIYIYIYGGDDDEGWSTEDMRACSCSIPTLRPTSTLSGVVCEEKCTKYNPNCQNERKCAGRKAKNKLPRDR